MLRSPRQNYKGIQIGIQILIRLVNTGEALNGRTIDHNLIVQGFFDLITGNSHIFHRSEDIRKLHTDKLHIFFPYDA